MSTRAQEFMAELRDMLKKQTTLTIGEQLAASDGSPTLLIGTSGAGNQNMFIKVKDEASLFKTGLGLAQRAFGNPLRVQLSLEASSVAGAVELDMVNWLPIICSIALRGAVVDAHLVNDGTAVGVGGDINGTLVATWYPDPKFKLQSSQ